MDAFFLAIAAAVLGTLGWAAMPWPANAQRIWELIAETLGLSVGRPERAFPGVLSGVVGGYPITLKSSGLGVQIVVSSNGEIPAELRIRWTGSAEVEAPRRISLAAITPEVSRLLDRAAGELLIEDGEIRQFLEGPVTQRMIDTARNLTELCRALSFSSVGIHERLMARFEEEPTQELLQAVLTDGPPDPIRERAIERGLKTADPKTLLLAAKNAGERGIEPLERLLKEGPDEIQAEALRALKVDAVRLRDLLSRAGPRLRAAIAESAGTLSDEAEPILLALLEDGDTAVQTYAAESLGKIGTLSAVAPLIQVLDTLLAPARLRMAAYDAVRAIQSRAGVVERGRLSVVEPGPGGTLGFPDRLG